MRETKDDRRIRFSLKSILSVTAACAVVLSLGVDSIPLVLAALAVPYLWKHGHRGWGATVVAALVLLLLLFGVGITVSVRLDTGDQRVTYWGIPVAYRPMREPIRSSLLSVQSKTAPRGWRWCAREAASDGMVYRFYLDAAAWVEVDPEIARLVVSDLASYLDTTHATSGLPYCMTMIWPDVVDRVSGENPRVIDGWQKNPEVLAYLATKGYSSNSTTTQASPPRKKR
jgi:hypothetical protein